MSIPVSTTTVTIQRAPDRSNIDPEDYDETIDFEMVETGVRAVVDTATGGEGGPSGTAETVSFILLADPCDLDHLDRVIDEITGARYEVAWSVTSPGVGGMLGSTKAGLNTSRGS
jgi:hypothetical protein